MNDEVMKPGTGGILTSGAVANLADGVSRVLGRKVIVHHSRYQFKLHGKLKWSPWRYTLLFEGVTIPFSDLTINEAKSRLAMLTDLYYHGVFDDCNAAARRESRTTGGDGHPAQPTGGGQTALPVSPQGSAGGVPVIDKLGDVDDRY